MPPVVAPGAIFTENGHKTCAECGNYDVKLAIKQCIVYNNFNISAGGAAHGSSYGTIETDFTKRRPGVAVPASAGYGMLGQYDRAI
jgi:hypothetical protein